MKLLPVVIAGEVPSNSATDIGSRLVSINPAFKRLGAALLGILILLISSKAAAQSDAPFGARNQLAFSAERLFGLERATQTDSITGGTATTTTTGVSAFSNPGSFLSTYATPRVAVDGFVANRVSVGAALGLYTFARSTLSGSAETSSQETGVTVGPRAGYAAVLGRGASIWPRLGFAYSYATSSGAGSGGLKNTETQWALVVDAPLVVTVAPHLFVSIAPTVDIGLDGKLRTTSNIGGGPAGSQDVNETDFGLQFALGGYI
jgi:hypothetical protein